MVVLGHDRAVLVHASKVTLGRGIALCGGQRVQPDRLLDVLGHARAVLVHASKVVLGVGIALCGGQCVHPDRLMEATPLPLAYMTPRLYWASVSPCAAASAYSRTAPWESCATPMPSL